MKKRLLQIVSLLVCLSCFLNMSAQEVMDSLTIDSILSVRYPRIYPVYLDSTQIAEQVASCNVPVVSSAEMVNYTYQNAVFHRQGLGFCGFETIASVDNHDRTKTITYLPYKYSTPAKVVTPEYETIYNYSVSRRSNGTLRIVLGSKIENDLLKDTSMPTLIDYDDYCNPTYVSTYYPDGSAANKTNSYSNTTTVGDGYYLGSLWEQISKRHKEGEPHQERIFIPAGSNGYPNVKIHYIGENQTDITVFMYDSCGNTLSKNVTPYSSSVSHLTSYNYDSYGRLIKETNPMGLTKEYFFDEKGRVSSSKDKRNNVTTYAYDSFGRDTLTVYPDGTKKTIKYTWSTDRDGELYSITTSETGQPAETVYYDALNREVRRGTVRFDGSIIYVDKVYNSKGKLEKESLPYKTGSASLWNVYTYDEHDRVIAYTEASGRTTTYAYNGTKVTTVEDGVSITRDYDSHGNLITVEDAAGTVTYNLWVDGQPSSIVAPGDVTITFGYDEYRRRTSINDPSHGLTTYHYDSAGNVLKEVNARGDSTVYYYDNFNRPIEIIYLEMTTWYYYTPYNELQNINSNNGTAQHFSYDNLGQIINKSMYTVKGGTQRHKYAKDMVDKYQGIYGDKTDFTLEKVFVNESEGYKIRPNVISKTKKIIYDYKFGYSYYKIGHFLCTKQMQRYKQTFPYYKIEIIHIEPKK